MDDWGLGKGVISVEKYKKYWGMLIESNDKGMVLIASSVIEDALTEIIKARLIDSLSVTDALFSGEGSPLSTFSAKVELAYRIGAINEIHRKTLTVFRRLRNDFAHNAEFVSLASPLVADRVNAIFATQQNVTDAIQQVAKDGGKDPLNVRQKFIAFFAGEMMALSQLPALMYKVEKQYE